MRRIKSGIDAGRAGARRERRRFAQGRSKRAFDCAFAATSLLVLWPMFLLTCLFSRILNGGPVFFAHTRVGKDGIPFKCYKFRTMVADAEAVLAAHLANSVEARAEWAAARKLKKDPRILGRFARMLRKTSIDELPQLFNVLRGDMSLVGPRPVVTDELSFYDDQARWYLSIRPGLTGPWQVTGRSDTTYAERVALDVSYAMNASFRRDLAILAKTILVIVTRRGAR